MPTLAEVLGIEHTDNDGAPPVPPYDIQLKVRPGILGPSFVELAIVTGPQLAEWLTRTWDTWSLERLVI